ncbi:helix-turn-helix domain-containing protein [Halomicroarcula sp. GCM10025709]|uniref:helix-turn-helix domain-containing protein n=1 Tax=Halomicroarcula sp. GCM10025709 TaxID=3252669 RepID=UPI00362045A7
MTDGINITDPDIAPLRPSAKLIYLVLEAHGPCDLTEIRTRTQLPDTTAREALEDLVERGLVDKDHVPGDTRCRQYDT